MFYRYEHYMSISHMALIVAMEQEFSFHRKQMTTDCHKNFRRRCCIFVARFCTTGLHSKTHCIDSLSKYQLIFVVGIVFSWQLSMFQVFPLSKIYINKRNGKLLMYLQNETEHNTGLLYELQLLVVLLLGDKLPCHLGRES